MPAAQGRTIGVAAALAIGVLLATALNIHGQPKARTYRLGVLLYSTPTADSNVAIFREAMRAAGYVEGRNVTFEYRYAEGKPERLKALAEELVLLKPDLIYAVGGDVVPSAKNATQTIPIVGLMSLDPVRAGIVPSLAHPGGNLTGFTFMLSELAGKRLEFLREMMPRLSRVAVVWNPDHPDPDFKDTQAAASHLGIRLQSIEVRKLDDFDEALAMAMRDRAEAIIVVSSRLMNLRQRQLLDFAAKNRIPIATGWGAWVQNGALLSYGPNIDDIVRQSVSHVDKILRGAKPADLPLEQPTRFELVLNLKTARTLNLAVPQSLVARADRVIE
jgi:putative tryptophan/tyrosine transport system substrate-binding protein